MNKILNTIDKILAYSVITLMSLLVVNVLLQVLARYIFDSPVSFTEELARFMLVWLGLLASSYAYRQRLHLALDLLPNKVTGSAKMWLTVFIHSTIGLFALLGLVYGGLRLVHLIYILDQTSASLGIPLAFVYMVLPISGIIILLYAINFIMEALSTPEESGNEAEQHIQIKQ